MNEHILHLSLVSLLLRKIHRKADAMQTDLNLDIDCQAKAMPGDNRYYEATYNGDKDELYIDMYYKQANRCYKNVSNQSQELNQ